MVQTQQRKAPSIAGLAKAGGVGVETVRYYQRRGLLDKPDRRGNAGHGGTIRRYGDDDVRRLRFIRAAQAAGFALDEIGELILLDASEDRSRALTLAEGRIAALDAKIAELKRARRALSRLAHDCAASDQGPCPILTAFEHGRPGHGRLEHKHHG
jgi:MerR family transcriptional regulator, mercuric resistance operon regulatory protein